jgi:hypothetical protein
MRAIKERDQMKIKMGSTSLHLGVAIAVLLAGVAAGYLFKSTVMPVTSASSGEAESLVSIARQPQSIDDLVRPADIIVIGTVGRVVNQGAFGGYDQNGVALIERPDANERATLPGATPVPSEALPFTDFEINVEEVILDNGDLRAEKPLILRMVGLPTDGVDAGSVYPMSHTGDRHLFLLSANPDKATYGFYYGPYSRLNIDGSTVTCSDGARTGLSFAGALSPLQFVQAVKVALQERGRE